MKKKKVTNIVKINIYFGFHLTYFGFNLTLIDYLTVACKNMDPNNIHPVYSFLKEKEKKRVELRQHFGVHYIFLNVVYF